MRRSQCSRYSSARPLFSPHYALLAEELFCSVHQHSRTSLKTAVWNTVRKNTPATKSRGSSRITCECRPTLTSAPVFSRTAPKILCVLDPYLVASAPLLSDWWVMSQAWCCFCCWCHRVFQFRLLSPHDRGQQGSAAGQRPAGSLLWCWLWEEPQRLQLLEEQVGVAPWELPNSILLNTVWAAPILFPGWWRWPKPFWMRARS